MKLTLYQKCILFLLAAMLIIFTVLYIVTASQVGFAYSGSILIPSYEDNRTLYAGTIEGKQAQFVVTADHVITFTYGGKTYGPYTVREDPSAVPADKNYLTGYEILDGDKVFFRGGVHKNSDYYEFYDENGNWHNAEITVSNSNGSLTYDKDGNLIDPMAPSKTTLLQLVSDPKLTHKGNWEVWFLGLLLSIATAVSVLFADALFRFRMSFRISNPDDVEPSDWELGCRYVGWALSALIVLIIFIKGLQ